MDKKELPYVLAVELKETGELIGDTGVNEVDGAPGEVEIGYTICKKHSGKGCATELLRAMTDFTVSTFGIHVLYGRVMLGNSASVRVLEKNGYAFVREEIGAEDDPTAECSYTNWSADHHFKTPFPGVFSSPIDLSAR